MYKFIKALCLSIFVCAAASAQTTGNADEYKKNEYFVGYSNQQVDSGTHNTFNGFEVSYVRNIHRYFGIKADVSAAFRNDDFNVTANDPTNGNYTFRGESSRQVYNFLGGIQVKDNASQGRFKPFAHALAGVSVNRFKTDRLTCTAGTCPTFVNNSIGASFNDTGFGMAFGGGLDIKINDRIDFRAIQVDYNPIYSSSRFDHNVRFGIGVVFK